MVRWKRHEEDLQKAITGFDLSGSDIDTLLGNTTHGLPAGKYAVAKMISDNGTSTDNTDDFPVWELQSVVWDAAADGGNGDFVPNSAANAPAPVTISGITNDGEATTAVTGLTAAQAPNGGHEIYRFDSSIVEFE